MSGIDGYTKIMLHNNGDDESPVFTDDSASAHTVTAHGTAQIDTVQSKFGGASGLFDGNSDYLSIPDHADFDLGSGDFTIEGWFRFAGISAGYTGLFDQFYTTRAFAFAYHNTDGLYFNWSTDGSNVSGTSRSWTASLNTWYHLAVVRSGTAIKIFVDGTQLGTDISIGSDTIYNTGVPLFIGASHAGDTSPTGFFNGWIDEIRWSKAIARWTSNFSVPTEEYSDSELFVTINETVVCNDAFSEDITVQFNETVVCNDTLDALIRLSVSIDETVVCNDVFDTETYTNIKTQIDETVVCNDSFSEDITVQIDESVVCNDVIDATVPQGTANLGIEIVSVNPLVFVSYTSPAKITKVDVTVPASITWEAVEITGFDNATSCIYNSTTGYVYITGDNGEVAKIELNDLSNQTIIDTLETDSLELIDCQDDFFRTYIATDDSNGEIVVIDEREMKQLNTDLRWVQKINSIINTQLNTILASRMNTDLRYRAIIESAIGTDLRWIKTSYDQISQTPINYDDLVVKINGTDLAPLNDVDLKSIVITHTIDDKSTATFRLNRRHDQINFDNQGNASEITDNNPVIIEIDGNEEFNGKISNVDTESDNESVIVIAQMDQPADQRHTISIPLPSVNENLHLYHCLKHNPKIDKFVLDTRMVVQGSNSQWWTGSTWTSTLTDSLTFVTYDLAQTYIDGRTDSLFTNNTPVAANYEQDGSVYNGIIVNLGTKIEQNSYRLQWVGDVVTLAETIEKGEFTPKQNWSYFWLGKARNFITGSYWGTMRYLGTSFSSLTNDTWKTNGASYKYQKIKDDIETELGVYQVGSAPYDLSIKPKNGIKIVKDRWEDKDDGLYTVRDEGYDYEQYAKDYADLEYEKLQNINGNVSPITADMIDISVDAYYYYNIKLLTRINITNTTTTDIYNGNKGFPVAVKSITLSTAGGDNGFKVSLQCDNQKSLTEIEEIDARYPDENSDEYLFPETSALNHSKFDPNTWSYPA